MIAPHPRLNLISHIDSPIGLLRSRFLGMSRNASPSEGSVTWHPKKTSAKEATVRVVLFLFCLLNSSSFCSVHPNIVRIHVSRKRGRFFFSACTFWFPESFSGNFLGCTKKVSYIWNSMPSFARVHIAMGISVAPWKNSLFLFCFLCRLHLILHYVLLEYNLLTAALPKAGQRDTGETDFP